MGYKVLRLMGDNCKMLFNGKLSLIPIKDEYIIQKSIELFNDSEPCIIHRSYIQKSIILEFENYFEDILRSGKNELLWNEVCDGIKDKLNFNDTINKVIIEIH